MYKKPKIHKTTLKVDQSYEGETLEDKINRIVNNNEPITDGAPLVYTNRADGVPPAYDIRTDRFEIATEAMDKVTKSHIAKREERGKIVGIDEDTQKKDSGTEPIQGTNGTGDSK